MQQHRQRVIAAPGDQNILILHPVGRLARTQRGAQQVVAFLQPILGKILELNDLHRALRHGGNGTAKGVALADAGHVAKQGNARESVHACTMRSGMQRVNRTGGQHSR